MINYLYNISNILSGIKINKINNEFSNKFSKILSKPIHNIINKILIKINKKQNNRIKLLKEKSIINNFLQKKSYIDRQNLINNIIKYCKKYK